jgi:hypothetical protein
MGTPWFLLFGESMFLNLARQSFTNKVGRTILFVREIMPYISRFRQVSF